MLKAVVGIFMQLLNIHKFRESDNCPLNSLQAEYLIKLSEANTTRIQKLEKLAYATICLIIALGATNVAGISL
jgi:hypothetical protein